MPGKIIQSNNYQKFQKVQTSLLSRSTCSSAGLVKPFSGDDIGYGGLNCFGEMPQARVKIDDFMKSPDALKKSQFVISGYDESIFQYRSLEGTLNAYAHCINSLTQSLDEYEPIIYLSLGFYTASRLLIEANPDIGGMIHHVNGDSESQSTNEGDKERFEFLLNHSTPNSILFVDGPIFTGASTGYNYDLSSHRLPKKNCFPVFLVKNSSSSIINDKYSLGYNNDLHWAFNLLRARERTAYFSYTSQTESGAMPRSKVFCYIKPGTDLSPCRLEMSRNIFNFFSETKIQGDNLLGLVEKTIIHQFLLNGLHRNTQVRIIEIAEKYAREALKSTHIYQLADQFGLTATMNEARGFT